MGNVITHSFEADIRHQASPSFFASMGSWTFGSEAGECELTRFVGRDRAVGLRRRVRRSDPPKVSRSTPSLSSGANDGDRRVAHRSSNPRSASASKRSHNPGHEPRAVCLRNECDYPIIKLWNAEGDRCGTTGVIIIIAGRWMDDTPFPEVRDEAGRLGNFHWSYFSKVQLMYIWSRLRCFARRIFGSFQHLFILYNLI